MCPTVKHEAAMKSFNKTVKEINITFTYFGEKSFWPMCLIFKDVIVMSNIVHLFRGFFAYKHTNGTQMDGN